MVFVSILVGIIAGISALATFVALISALISQHAETLTAAMLLAYLSFTALCAMAAAVVSGLVTLGLLVRLVRGRGAIGFSMPAGCTSLAAWAYSSWRFYGRGYQQGLRVLGVEIALKGHVC